MARDYSGQRNHNPRNAKGKSKPRSNRPKPATRPAKKSRRSGHGGPPGWVWMICGLCIGLTIAAGFYVFGRPAGTGERQQIQIATPKADSPDSSREAQAGARQSDAPPKEKEPRFSFYKMLPNYEVVIPEEEYPDEKKGSNPTPGEPPPPPSSASTPEPTTPRVDEPGRYIIQAGSFSTHGDADRRKAEISLLGVSARIVSVDLASGKTVYRVQSTPITSSDELNKILKRLRKNRIDTMVMRATK